MNAIDTIQFGLKLTQNMLHMMLKDFSDAELLIRPVPGANHMAWQLGHLITSESSLGKYLPGVVYPELPAGFAEQHGKEGAGKDSGFLPRDEYLALFDKARVATMGGVARLSESDLDQPTGWDIAPTLGGLLVLMGGHVNMHTGQLSVVRRKLGKPVLF